MESGADGAEVQYLLVPGPVIVDFERSKILPHGVGVMFRGPGRAWYVGKGGGAEGVLPIRVDAHAVPLHFPVAGDLYVAPAGGIYFHLSLGKVVFPMGVEVEFPGAVQVGAPGQVPVRPGLFD